MTAADALRALSDGDAPRAAELASAAGGRLGTALAAYLDGVADGRVYDDPAAFQAFITGGGNVPLYRAVSALLAGAYAGAERVLDIGAGDGRAVVPAATSVVRPPALDLVEPSKPLLDAAVATARAAGLTVSAHHVGALEFVRSVDARWDVGEATFALHAIPPADRQHVLAGLRGLVGRLVVVEFDVPAFTDGSDEHLAYLADRYEHGLAEYEGDLVATGFLLPVLTGQVAPGRVRSTWECPADGWADQLRTAGFEQVTIAPVADYWWAPAVAITGS